MNSLHLDDVWFEQVRNILNLTRRGRRLHDNPSNNITFARKHLSTYSAYGSAIQQRVAERAGYRCGYCQTQEAVISIPLHIAHITPGVVGGSSNEDNLWLAGSGCSLRKAARQNALDPETNERVSHFSPRAQNWANHFMGSDEGIEVIGLTFIGWVTVLALKWTGSDDTSPMANETI